MWDVVPSVLSGQVATSASRPQRWAQVLGNDALLEDMVDYFTYAQVCTVCLCLRPSYLKGQLLNISSQPPAQHTASGPAALPSNSAFKTVAVVTFVNLDGALS